MGEIIPIVIAFLFTASTIAVVFVVPILGIADVLRSPLLAGSQIRRVCCLIFFGILAAIFHSVSHEASSNYRWLTFGSVALFIFSLILLASLDKFPGS